MNWKQRVGTAYQALTDSLPKPKEKTISQLGSGFLDLSAFKLASDKKVSPKLLQAYYGWVYANVSVLAEEISKMEFELYSIGLSKGEIVYNPIDSHPLLDLLDRWNPFTTTSEAMYMTEAHLELAGDTFYLLDNPTTPTSIFILDPTKVTPVPGDDKDGYNIVKYEYRPNLKNQKEIIEYEPEYIIQVKNPHPSNPYRGKSVVEAAAQTIDTDTLAGEFLKKLFENSAVNGFVLSTDQRVTAEELERMEIDLRRNFAGSKNAFKTMILTGGLKPTAVQQTNKELNFLEIELAMRDKIMALFKNTKASLGITDDVNRANAEATLLSWKQSVIKPKMQRIVDTLNEFLVSRFGDNLILTFVDPVADDASDDIEEVVALMSNTVRQVMTVNEAREKLGLQPIKDSDFDTITTPAGNPFLQPIQESITPSNVKNVDYRSVLRRQGIYQKSKDMKDLYVNARAVAKQAIEGRKKEVVEEVIKNPYHSYTYEQAIDYWAKQIQIAEVVEARFLTKLNQFIGELEEKTILNLHAIVPKKYKANKVKAINPFDEDDAIEAGIDLFTPLYKDIAQLAGSEAYRLLKLKTLYKPSKNLHKNIESAVKEFTQSFVKTDRDKLVAILEDGITQGLGIPEMERTIRGEFESYRKNQSEKIARTETIRASNQGALDAFKESGVVEGKQWLTAEDDRVDDECAELDGKIVGLEGEFFGTDYGSGEEPPLHPNCRCVLIPVITDEKSLEPEMLKLELKEKDKLIAEYEELLEISGEGE